MSVLAIQLYLNLCKATDSSPPGSSVHGDSLGKETGVGCHALLQGIFLTQGSNPHLLHLLQWPHVPPALEPEQLSKGQLSQGDGALPDIMAATLLSSGPPSLRAK